MTDTLRLKRCEQSQEILKEANGVAGQLNEGVSLNWGLALGPGQLKMPVAGMEDAGEGKATSHASHLPHLFFLFVPGGE